MAQHSEGNVDHLQIYALRALLGTKPLVPVSDVMVLGCVRISYLFTRSNQGMRKWVPSGITLFLIPPIRL